MTPELSRDLVVRVVATLLVVALVVPFVVFAVPQVVGGEQSFVVVSGSMEPNIGVGDAVVVADVAGDDVRVNDVITFVTADRTAPTTHRVVEIRETPAGREFVTKGDNNEDPDASPVTPDRLVGRVILTIPYIGYVVEFVSSTTGFVLLVVSPIVLLVATELWNVVRRAREDSAGDGDDTGGDGPSVDAPAVATVATATDSAAESDEPAGWSVGVRDLTVTMAVVGVAALYSGVVAYLVYDGSVTYMRLLQLSVSAFAAFAVAFAVLLGMRLFVEPSADGAAVADSGVLRGSLDDATRALPTVTVGDAAELRAMAAGAGRWLVQDDETGRLSYSDGTMLYVCDARADDAGAGDTAVDDDAASDEPLRDEVDDSALDRDESDDWTVVDDAVDTDALDGEEAAWAALFGDADALGEPGLTFPADDARPDGGENDA